MDAKFVHRLVTRVPTLAHKFDLTKLEVIFIYLSNISSQLQVPNFVTTWYS